MRVLIGNLANRTSLGNGKERFLFGTGCRFSWSLIKNVEQRPRYAMLPLFMAYATALLENDGFDVQVLDGVPLNLTPRDFHERAKSLRPDLIVFEPCTATLPITLAAAKRLREATNARVILAGPHVSALPHEVLESQPAVDFVLVGEYEFTLLQVARLLRDRRAVPEMPGLALRNREGKVSGGKPSATIEPLGMLPFPARHLFPSNQENDLSVYHDGFCQHRPAIQMHSSRGCPFRCDFCLWAHTLYAGTGRYRAFEPQRVVDEMIHVRDRYGAREVYFDDDAFNLNKQHAMGVCAEIQRRGLKLPWSIMSDFRLLDAEMLSTLAGAGCIGIKFGIESLAPEVQRHMQKDVELAKIREVTAQAAKLGIKTHGTICVGLPGETAESFERSFEYCCQLDSDSIQFYLSTPFPGTPFYNQLRREDRIRARNWTEFDGTRCIISGEFGDPRSLEDLVAQAGGRWLKRKLVQPKWAGRQCGYLLRLAKGQGIRGLTRRLGRAAELLLKA
jgi:anaerobic magnesium-protoporphyrin IX monomethyl ester cyclase